MGYGSSKGQCELGFSDGGRTDQGNAHRVGGRRGQKTGRLATDYAMNQIVPCRMELLLRGGSFFFVEAPRKAMIQANVNIRVSPILDGTANCTSRGNINHAAKFFWQ